MNYLKGKQKKIRALLEKEFPHALRFYEGMINHEERYSEWLKSNLASTLSEFSFDAEVLF
jgi:hypothetical protein